MNAGFPSGSRLISASMSALPARRQPEAASPTGPFHSWIAILSPPIDPAGRLDWRAESAIAHAAGDGTEREGFEPSRELAPPTRLAGECLQPLGHLSGPGLDSRYARPGLNLDRLHGRYETLFESVQAPFAFVDLDAMRSNAASMLAMAGGKPVRVATKSVRSAPLTRRILDLDEGFRGLLAFTLPEALHLAELGFRDIVVAYPTADRAAISALAELSAADPDAAPAVMVDSREQLDLIEGSIGSGPAEIKVCLDLDTSWWALGGRVKIGPKRSPIRTPEEARNLARNVERRPGTRVIGLMAYEGHVAGIGDIVPGKRIRSLVIRWMQERAMRDLAERRAAIVELVRKAMEVEFVNGGGTGSLARTAAEDSVTELTAGSGFYAPTLFDRYRSLELTPAAFFVLPVDRKPADSIATALGGGYVASGAPGPDKLPVPYLPTGLRLDPRESAGEVQTPLLGERAEALRLGDRIYFRHAKAGELCERFGSLFLVEGDRIADEVATYRGDGLTFL